MGLLKTIIQVALGAGLDLFRGFVLSKLWVWFLVPVFGLPPIGVMLATGLTYTAAHASSILSTKIMEPSDGKSFSDMLDQIPSTSVMCGRIIGHAFNAAILLGFAYLIHLFV